MAARTAQPADGGAESVISARRLADLDSGAPCRYRPVISELAGCSQWMQVLQHLAPAHVPAVAAAACMTVSRIDAALAGAAVEVNEQTLAALAGYDPTSGGPRLHLAGTLNVDAARIWAAAGHRLLALEAVASGQLGLVELASAAAAAENGELNRWAAVASGPEELDVIVAELLGRGATLPALALLSLTGADLGDHTLTLLRHGDWDRTRTVLTGAGVRLGDGQLGQLLSEPGRAFSLLHADDGLAVALTSRQRAAVPSSGSAGGAAEVAAALIAGQVAETLERGAIPGHGLAEAAMTWPGVAAAATGMGAARDLLTWAAPGPAGGPVNELVWGLVGSWDGSLQSLLDTATRLAG